MKNDARDSVRPGMSSRFFALCLFLPFALAMEPGLWAQSCRAPQNPIEAENCNSGNPPSEWDIDGIGDSSIQGFAIDISENQGGTGLFKINTNATSNPLDIYRMGYYGGNGARNVATVLHSVPFPQNPPSCLADASTYLNDCGNWGVAASWNVPATAILSICLAVPAISICPSRRSTKPGKPTTSMLSTTSMA